MKIKISNEVVYFPNGISIELPCARDGNSLELDGKVLLLLGRLEDNHRNIWCFDLEGNKLWEIEPSDQRGQ